MKSWIIFNSVKKQYIRTIDRNKVVHLTEFHINAKPFHWKEAVQICSDKGLEFEAKDLNWNHNNQ